MHFLFSVNQGAPLKVSLDPSLARLTDATLHLLKQLEIKSTHVIIDDSPISTLIKYYFTHSQKFMNNCLRSLNVKFLRITRFMSPSRVSTHIYTHTDTRIFRPLDSFPRPKSLLKRQFIFTLPWSLQCISLSTGVVVLGPPFLL